MHCSGLTSDLKHLFKHIFRGGGADLLKIKLTINFKKLKNGQKYAIKFDRTCTNAKHMCHQQINSKLRNRGEGGLFSIS